MAPSAPTVAVSSYIDVLDQYQFIEVINNCRFLKAIKALDRRSGHLVFIKLFIKPSPEIALGSPLSAVAADCRVLLPLPDTLPWTRLIETDHAAYLVRQLVTTNLYDRLSLRPFLQPLEKDFMVYQILMIISRIHKKRIRHGDIKLENMMVTSWNWLTLSDFAAHIKPVHLPEDNPSEFSFYFDTSNRRACYVAPERFHSAQLLAKISSKSTLNDAMDLFSVGCAIAELYADGEPAFTLSQLFQYMRGEYTISLASVENPDMRRLISSLVTIDPFSRPLTVHLLQKYRGSCFPEIFYSFLYDYMAQLNDDKFFYPQVNEYLTLSDVKIRHIHDNFELIVEGLNLKYATVSTASDGAKDFSIPIRLIVPGIPLDSTMAPTDDSPTSSGACLIILNVVFSLVKALTQVETKIMACSLILAISARIENEHRLDRALPYLCTLIDEYCEFLAARLLANDQTHDGASAKVVCVAIQAITTLLLSCSTITPINVLVFPEYIIPKIITLLTVAAPEAEKTMVEVTIAACIPSLARTSSKFWLMSRSFSSGGLGQPLALMLALRESGLAEMAPANIVLGVPRGRLVSEFESITLALLTSTVTVVKLRLLQDVGNLCRFLGVDITSDVVLPHLITYLNDPNYQVRLAFLDSVLQVGPFVGILAFEQYILPLLMQTLQDTEQLVVIKVLQVFYTFVESRLINPRTQFNALGIYQELLQSSAPLLLHPNEWIRQSVLHLFLAVSNEVTDANRYCFVFPMLKRYLAFDTDQISWNDIYPALTKPLSTRVYDAASVWSLRATSKSLFWRNQHRRTPSRLIHTSKKHVVSFSKEMGKSVYLPRSGVNENADESSVSVPISSEDKQWLSQLKALDFGGQDAWKLLLLRPYIFQVSRVAGIKKSINDTLEPLRVSPEDIQSVAWKAVYRLEFSPAEVEVLQDTDQSTTIDMHDKRPESQALLLPGLFRARALVQTIEANVFGELDVSNDVRASHNSSGVTRRRRLVSDASNKAIIATVTYDYSMPDPYTLNFLQTLDLKPTINDFAEFGPRIDSPAICGDDRMFRGQLIARIRAGKREKDTIDGIRCLAICEVLLFFVTGLESGLVEVWDASSTEVLFKTKRPSLEYNMGARITSIQFVPNRLAFLTTTSDGKNSIMRVEVSQSFDKCLLRFTKLRVIRNLDFEIHRDGFAVAAAFNTLGPNHRLFCATSYGKIVEMDIGCGITISKVQNPLHHGNITTILVDPSGLWTLVGTDSGIFDLWDMRFQVLLSSWQLQVAQGNTAPTSCVGATKIRPLSNDQFAMTISSIPGVTIWQIPSFACVEVLPSTDPTNDGNGYSLKKIGARHDVEDISKWITSFAELTHVVHDDISNKGSNECTALATSFGPGSREWVVTATSDRRTHQWKRDAGSSFSKGETIGSCTTSADSLSTATKNAVPDNSQKACTPSDVVMAIERFLGHNVMVVSVDRGGFIHIYL